MGRDLDQRFCAYLNRKIRTSLLPYLALQSRRHIYFYSNERQKERERGRQTDSDTETDGKRFVSVSYIGIRMS